MVKSIDQSVKEFGITPPTVLKGST